MKSSNEIIRLEDLTKSFNTKVILNRLALKVDKGQFITIFGASGSGKSTLLNIIGFLDQEYAGRYYFSGDKIKSNQDLTFLRSNKIGFIFQLYYLLPKLTITENILLPYLYRRDYNKTLVNERLEALVERLKLQDLLSQASESLSGGEKQRVAIARALINEPDLIICDEPTGNLDKDNCDIILKILKEEQRKGRTIVVVTHSEEIANYSDKIYCLEGGTLRDVR